MKAWKYGLCHFPPEGTLTTNMIMIQSKRKKQKAKKVLIVTTMKLRLPSFLVCIGKKRLAHYVTSLAPNLSKVIHYVFSTVKMKITVYNFVFSSMILCRQG